MEAEVERVRQLIAKGPRGTSRRYTGKLREDIAKLARVMRVQGKSWSAIGKVLGVGQETLQRLGKSVEGVGNTAGKNARFVPVVIRDDSNLSARSLTLVSPRGYRVEGLDVVTAAELLGRLA